MWVEPVEQISELDLHLTPVSAQHLFLDSDLQLS